MTPKQAQPREPCCFIFCWLRPRTKQKTKFPNLSTSPFLFIYIFFLHYQCPRLKTDKSSYVMFVYEEPITPRYLCPSPLAFSITIICWKQVQNVSVRNSHLCAIQKPLNQTRIFGSVATITIKYYTCLRKTVYALTSVLWHLRMHSRFQSTHYKTLCCYIFRSVSWETFSRCREK